MKLSLSLLSLIGIATASGSSQFFFGDGDTSLKVPGKNPLTFCAETTDYVLSLDYLNLSPNPPEAGKNLTVTVGGTLSETVKNGSIVHITVKWGFLTLINKDMDLCENAKIVDEKCPVKKGLLHITKEVAIPSEIPPGKYSVTAEASTNATAAEKAKTITCMKGEITFGI